MQNDLAIITGFMPLPPIHTLGFHFSKFAEVSADILTTRSQQFSQFNFPVDVLWMDILYAKRWTNKKDDYLYFDFTP